MRQDDTAERRGPGPAKPVGLDSLLGHPLTNRLSRAGQRLRQLDQRRPWLLDTAVVVLIALVFCVPDLVHHEAPRDASVTFTDLPTPAVLLLQAGLVLPLLWRRRNPTAAFFVIAGVTLLQWLIGTPLRADVALLVALYSLVLHGSLTRLPWVAASLVAVIGVISWRVSDAISAWDAAFFISCAVTAAAAIGFAVRIRRAQLAALRERARQLEIERDQRSRLAAAAERTRVAREMHDIVGHSLSVIITLADGGAYANAVAPERGTEALQRIAETGRRALGELRRMLGVLRDQTEVPHLSPQPTIADIGALCDRIRAAGPQVNYRTAGDVDALDLGIQLAAYRITQEALTNTLKHAGPHTRVWLDLTVARERLEILVRDSGPSDGTEQPARPVGEGHGLIGMTERAALYGGAVVAGPVPGGGWSVRATLDVMPPLGSGGEAA